MTRDARGRFAAPRQPRRLCWDVERSQYELRGGPTTNQLAVLQTNLVVLARAMRRGFFRRGPL